MKDWSWKNPRYYPPPTWLKVARAVYFSALGLYAVAMLWFIVEKTALFMSLLVD